MKADYEEERSESGDTLIEVLIAVVIIALSATALLGALLTSITGSVSHRSLSVDDTVLRSFSEAAKEQIELQSSPLYAACATSYPISYAVPTSDLPPAVPLPYTVQINSQVPPSGQLQGIQYWDGNAFQSGCPSKDLGIQLITASATNPTDHVSQQLSFVVRNPSYAP